MRAFSLGFRGFLIRAGNCARRARYALMLMLLACTTLTAPVHAAPAVRAASAAPVARAVGAAGAVSASHITAAKEVLRILRVRESIAPMVAQLSALISEQIEQWRPPVEQQAEVDKTISKLSAVLAAELSWTNLEADYVVLYTENFNEAELKEIARFFRTGTGAKYVASAPAMQQKMLNISQLRIARVQPQVELLLGDLKRHLDTVSAQRDLAPAAQPAQPAH